MQKYLAFMKSKTEVSALPELHFFDGTEGDLHPDTMAMASFPRSGNTMLRAYLERITGIVTGSDVDIELGLNAALMEEGLEGEGMIDSRVWVVKTHYPERHGVCMYFPKRCVMVLRDPIDCIPSLFHLTLTDSHDLSVIDEDFFTF